MVALKATALVTLLFALQGATALTPAADGSITNKVILRSAKHEQRQAAQKPPVLQAQPSTLPDPTLASGKGNGKNAQFITGECVNSADCGASQTDLTKVCCASVQNSAGATVGVCSGSAVGNAAPKLGCGFGDGKVNSAAGAGAAQGGAAQGSGTQSGSGAASSGAAANNAASGGNAGGAASGAAASAGGTCPPTSTNDSLGPGNVGVAGKQFVTGQCTSDGNCASNCCVLGGGSDKSIAVCRNEPALKPTEKCGFTCTA